MADRDSYEIEIKSLLGSKEKADDLVRKMKAADPKFLVVGSHKQLNHYFVGGDLHQLFQNTKEVVEKDQLIKFQQLADKAKDFSVRSRWADGKVILVIKASVDDTTSSNGTARLEWESSINLKLDELDELILKSGFQYQAKWSRERQEFKYHAGVGADTIRPLQEVNVAIDKNAGYGYLSEFEMVVDNKDKADETKALLRKMMAELNVSELPQDRLSRMFDFYNKNWRDYYGTDKIFDIE
jgi:adenylate cyclase class IV